MSFIKNAPHFRREISACKFSPKFEGPCVSKEAYDTLFLIADPDLEELLPLTTIEWLISY